MSYVEIGEKEGAKLLTGGNRLQSGAHAKGWFHDPTVFGDVDAKMRIAQEEIFGPVVSVIPFDGLDEAISIANGVTYFLSATIYTVNMTKAFVARLSIFTSII